MFIMKFYLLLIKVIISIKKIADLKACWRHVFKSYWIVIKKEEYIISFR